MARALGSEKADIPCCYWYFSICNCSHYQFLPPAWLSTRSREFGAIVLSVVVLVAAAAAGVVVVVAASAAAVLVVVVVVAVVALLLLLLLQALLLIFLIGTGISNNIKIYLALSFSSDECSGWVLSGL